MSRAELTEDEFKAHTMRIIETATADDIHADDVIAAMSKALATIVAVTARRDGVSFDELLQATLEGVATFAHEAR